MNTQNRYTLVQILKTKTKEIQKAQTFDYIENYIKNNNFTIEPLGYVVSGINLTKDGKRYKLYVDIQFEDKCIYALPEKQVMQYYYPKYK